MAVALALAISLAAAGVQRRGRVEQMNGQLVLHVQGTPEQMGEQHGRLLKETVQRAVGAVIKGVSWTDAERQRLIRGARDMEPHQPAEYVAELKALAKAAGVGYEALLLAQLFGDVQRAQWCSSYAVLGPATNTGECIVGRNMDYWDYGISKYGAVIIHFAPEKGHRFMTLSWAGIINGWTAMNEHGIVVANNTAYGARANSLAGISTCFMLRRIAQYATTVKEGVEIVRRGPRACGTNMIIAGGSPPAAAIVEFDHDRVHVRWARNGFVIATNEFRALYREKPMADDDVGGYYASRYSRLLSLVRANYGRITRDMNFAADRDVHMSINLQCVLLFPSDARFRVAMGYDQPAAAHPFRSFRMTKGGIVAAEPGRESRGPEDRKE